VGVVLGEYSYPWECIHGALHRLAGNAFHAVESFGDHGSALVQRPKYAIFLFLPERVGRVTLLRGRCDAVHRHLQRMRLRLTKHVSKTSTVMHVCSAQTFQVWLITFKPY